MKKELMRSLLVLSLFGAPLSHAANIVWNSPLDVSGDSDVVTTGTYFDSATAYSINDLTINTVTFNHALTPNSGTLGFNNSGITFSNYTFTNVSLGNGTPASISGDYSSLLNVASGKDNNDQLSVTISNLTVGTQYLVQLWTPYWDINWKTSFTGGANTSSFLNTGVVNNDGSVSSNAQYIIGSFVADATTQTIQTNAQNQWSLISALQVRTISAVPEPETYAMVMAGLGLIGFVSRRRKV